MDENELIKEIVKANAAEVYTDAAQPSIRVLGKSLAQCVSLFATPVGRMAEILEMNILKYINYLENVPVQNLVEPDTRILVPILEKLRYTDESVVSDYYAKILATASDKDTASRVLPTFIEILNRLSSDEILILEHIGSSQNSVNLDGLDPDIRSKFGFSADLSSVNLKGSLPVLEIKLYRNNQEGYLLLERNFCILFEKVNLKFPNNISIYLDNLISLGLLEKPANESFALGYIYQDLENHEHVRRYQSQIDSQQQRIELDKAKLNLTGLGKKLLMFGNRKFDE